MSEDLMRATIDARLAWAQERRLGRRIEVERRARRRRARRLAFARWWRSRTTRWPVVGARRLATVAPAEPSVELARVLEGAAHRIAELGTAAERPLFEAMAEVAAPSAPGAAAALVDRHGTEVSRLRAFGHLHSHLLEVLGPREHACLLELLGGGDGCERRVPAA